MKRSHAQFVLSLDIDGTLETGDPPGPLLLDCVRAAQSRGAIIGSCSDQTLAEQRIMWEDNEIVPAFVAGKTQLLAVRDRFPFATAFVHVGDTDVDRRWAHRAGFDFVASQLLESGSAPVELSGWIRLAVGP